jgi:hypothetical protein
MSLLVSERVDMARRGSTAYCPSTPSAPTHANPFYFGAIEFPILIKPTFLTFFPLQCDGI